MWLKSMNLRFSWEKNCLSNFTFVTITLLLLMLFIEVLEDCWLNEGLVWWMFTTISDLCLLWFNLWFQCAGGVSFRSRITTGAWIVWKVPQKPYVHVSLSKHLFYNSRQKAVRRRLWLTGQLPQWKSDTMNVNQTNDGKEDTMLELTQVILIIFEKFDFLPLGNTFF